MVFHLANADMLPLVGQKLALQNKNEGTALMAGCILLAQVVMVPMAMMVGRKADFSGRRPLFLAGPFARSGSAQTLRDWPAMPSYIR